MKRSVQLFLFSVVSILVYACGSGSFKEESFYVRGNCDMCKERIELGVKELKGVQTALYNVEKESINVVYDSTLITRMAIEEKCADLGHSTELVHKNEKHHAELPECCQETANTNKGKH